MHASVDLDRFSRTLASAAPDAVIYADVNGLIRFWNEAAERVFGFPEAEALGRSLDIIVPPDLRARHWAGYATTVRTGTTRYGAGDVLAVPALRKDGTHIDVEFSILPIRGDGGEVVGIAAILRDVSRRTAGAARPQRVVRVERIGVGVHAERDVRCPFSEAIDLIETFHRANPDHRVGPFGWARAHVECEASQVRDLTEHGRVHDAFSFSWHAAGRLPLPAVHGLITVRPHGDRTRLALDGEYVPPLGAPGRAFDTLVGRRIARRAIERFMDDLAGFVERSSDRMRAETRP